MLSFAPNFKEWYQNIPKKIFVKIIHSWCDGNQVQIIEDIIDNEHDYTQISSNLWDHFSVFVEEKNKSLLDGWYISQSGKKIIFAHKENILTRCGCGKSFSFKSGNEAKDKITLLKKKLRNKNKTIHHDE